MRADVPGQNPESAGGLENVQLWEVLWRLETEAASMNHAAEDLIQQDALFDEKRSTWHQRERADWRTTYERPRADWRELYEANAPKPRPPIAPAAPVAASPLPPPPVPGSTVPASTVPGAALPVAQNPAPASPGPASPMPADRIPARRLPPPPRRQGEETISIGQDEPAIDLPPVPGPPAATPAQGSGRRQRPAAFASQIKEDAPSGELGANHSEVTGAFRNVVYGIETETPAARLRDLLSQRSFDQLWTAGSALDGDKFAAFFAEEGFGSAEAP